MKNHTLKFALIGLWMASLSGGIYSFGFKAPDGYYTSLASYAGQKILLVVFNPSSSDFSQLKMLDSVQQEVPTVKVIAVPGVEFAVTQTSSIATGMSAKAVANTNGAAPKWSTAASAAIPDTTIANLQASLGLSLTMTRAMYVQKTDSALQHPLFAWLTHVAANTHFNRDVEAEGQLFFVSETGILYGICNKGIGRQQIEQILRLQPVQ